MSDTPKNPLLETQIPPMPPVVRLELPFALEVQRMALEYAHDNHGAMTPYQERALEKLAERILEARSR